MLCNTPFIGIHINKTSGKLVIKQLLYFVVIPHVNCRSHNLWEGGGQKVMRRYLISENVDNSGWPPKENIFFVKVLHTKLRPPGGGGGLGSSSSPSSGLPADLKNLKKTLKFGFLKNLKCHKMT